MQTINAYFSKHLALLKENGFLLVVYALLAEALLLGFGGFLTLFTVETLLPTFVTARFSLTKLLVVLVLFALTLGLLGRYLNISFPLLTKKSPALWLGLLWMGGIFAISLYKFPLPVIPIIIAGFFLVIFLFYKIFLDEEKSN
jgi:hypothetical protein